MKIKQGDLVLVPFPFSDLTSVKTRPALVISNSSLKGHDCILAAVTSQDSKFEQVELTGKDLESGSLPLKSYIRVGKVVSLDRNIIRRVVAHISQKKKKEVHNKLANLLLPEKS